MEIKVDKFTWTIIGVVGLLLVAAVITVNVTDSTEPEYQAYVEDDTPDAPVINAFLAVERGDLSMARAQYSQEVLDEIDSNRSYDPLTGRFRDSQSQRLRIIKVQEDSADPDRAYVTYAQDHYRSGGLLDPSSSWTQDGVVEVIREDNAWKINTPEFFY